MRPDGPFRGFLARHTTSIPGARPVRPNPVAVPVAVLTSIVLLGCLTPGPATAPVHPEPGPEPRAVLAGPLPGGPLPHARDDLSAGLAAIESANPDAAYGHLTAVLEQCGSSSLGQQALLTMAAAELDPRNPDPRRKLAAEAAAQVAARQDPDTWPGQIARSLYGIALRLGARPVDPVLPDVIELYDGSTAFAAAPAHPAADCGATEAWPGPGRRTPAALPSLGGASYPARISALRRRVAELEAERERLRRLTRP